MTCEADMIPSTAWTHGRIDGRREAAELLFGWMHEDWRIETQVFPPGSRVFAIASAGCTALALSERGYHVTAVDVNREQIQYSNERLDGEPPRPGSIDCLLALGRRLLPPAGMTYARLRQFLELSDPAEQVRYWRERLHTHRWRALVACALSPLILRSVYAAPLLSALPPRFPEILHARLERLWALHGSADNPYAWRLWLGRSCPKAPAPRGDPAHVEFLHADAAAFLEACAPQSFDAFSLSNIVDGATPEYVERLLCAVRRAAASGAVVVTRSIGLPRTVDEDHWAAQDRAGIWGSVSVCRAHR